jgi:hypothetical protein
MTTISNINQVIQQADSAREIQPPRGALEAGQSPAATPQEKLAAQGAKVPKGAKNEKTGADRDRRRHQKRRAGKPVAVGGGQTEAPPRGTGTLLDTVA